MLEEDDAVSLSDYSFGQFTCAFCGREMDDLRAHIESVHSNDLFKFLSGECGFNAQGPRHLREHIKAAHVGNAVTATLAIIDLEQGLEGHRRVEEDGKGVADANQLDAQGMPGPADLEVVSLEVESMLDSDGQDELFQCPECWISFTTKEGLEGHADRPNAVTHCGMHRSSWREFRRLTSSCAGIAVSIARRLLREWTMNVLSARSRRWVPTTTLR